MERTRSNDRPRRHVELDDPSPEVARRAVTDMAATVGLAACDAEGLVLAVSEVVANAHRHGAPPVRMVIQSRLGRVIVEVSDAGPGPGPSYIGVAADAPPPGATSGRGRWLAQRSCAEVVENVSGSGFTVRLTGGAATS